MHLSYDPKKALVDNNKKYNTTMRDMNGRDNPVEILISDNDEDAENGNNDYLNDQYNDELTTNDSSTKRFNLNRKNSSFDHQEFDPHHRRDEMHYSNMENDDIESKLRARILNNAKKKFLTEDTVVEIDVSGDEETFKDHKNKKRERMKNRDSQMPMPEHGQISHRVNPNVADRKSVV